MTTASTAASGTPAERPLSASEIYANARALSSYLRDKATEIDEARRLPEEVAARLRDAGMFRLMMPKDWGGPELSTVEQVEVVEEISRANPSAGWCVMIGCDSGFYAGYLDDAAARKLYPRLDMATAGMVFPGGRADRVEGGYRVNGQWAFGSGITHADVVSAGCVVYENGTPVTAGTPPRPLWRIMLAAASAYEVQDTWHTTGLRGTGSNDYRASDLFVPEERSFSVLEPARRDAPLWRCNNTFLPKLAAVPLGVARAMIDHVAETMQNKVETPGMKLYKNLTRVQTAIADAEMILGAARAYLFSAVERQWRKLEKNEPLTAKDRADFWLSMVNAAHSGRQAIRMLFDAVGGSAIYAHRGPFDRYLRDAETWCQHVVVQRRVLEAIGGMLLGADDLPWHPFL
jgi:alkylation response protein AidB-like acyl-CoA dehydrogenase